MATRIGNGVIRLLRRLTSTLAVIGVAGAIAFSVPYAVYLLGHSAPGMASASSSVLLLTQAMLALTLVLLFAGTRVFLRNRRRLIAAKGSAVGREEAGGDIRVILFNPHTADTCLSPQSECVDKLLDAEAGGIRYLEYDFATRELVYRNVAGGEVKRMSLQPDTHAHKRERRTLRALSEPLSRFVSTRVRAISSSIRIGAQ